MKSFLIKSLLTIAAGAVAGASMQARTVTYNVGPFDQLSQFGNLNVVYTCNPDSLGLATYDSDEDFSAAIEVSNTKGRLQIKEVPGQQLGEVPTIRVYSNSINSIKSEGNGEVTATLGPVVPTLSVSLVGNGRIICRNAEATEVNATITTGNGTIVIDGKCTDANFKLAGKGTIQADGLVANNAKCTAAGTGTIGLNALNSLDVRGLGSIKVYYMGNPTIKKFGNSKLIPIETPAESIIEDDTTADSSNAGKKQPSIVSVNEEEAEEVTIVVEEEIEEIPDE